MASFEEFPHVHSAPESSFGSSSKGEIYVSYTIVRNLHILQQYFHLGVVFSLNPCFLAKIFPDPQCRTRLMAA